jgi:hypothetical protein
VEGVECWKGEWKMIGEVKGEVVEMMVSMSGRVFENVFKKG